MKDLKDMLGKAPKGQDEDKKMAKMKALKDLKDTMSKSMGSGLMAGMKKVTVAAPDQEGIEKGLDKAKEIVKDAPEMESPEEESDEEMSESPEMEVEEALEKIEDPSEIDKLMKMLEEKKKLLAAKA